MNAIAMQYFGNAPPAVDFGGTDAALAAQILPLASGAVLIAHRVIQDGDEHALLPVEAGPFGNAVAGARRESGAARIAARVLLARFGQGEAAIPRSLDSRAPTWPVGIVGSLSHERRVAVAAVARSVDMRSIGVDIEPDTALPREIAAYVTTPREARRYDAATLASRRLFVAKEAVYKAAYALDGIAIDFSDIEIDLDAGTARIRYGRTVQVRMTVGRYLIALASIDANQQGSLSRRCPI
jgi:4'-phosphopantetheinyl transferase EntD